MSERASELSPATEDYAKAIFALQSELGGPVGTTAVAERLGVSPASASAMLRRLDEHGLVAHRRYHGVELTPAGRRAALRVLRSHRLLETYLAESLGVPWDRVHEEAEVLEHVLSDELEALIAAKLGHPTHDPHGDPIPDPELRLESAEGRTLSELAAGESTTVARVPDWDAKLLRYLGELALVPGAAVEVVARAPFNGPITVRSGSGEHAIVRELAGAIAVA